MKLSQRGWLLFTGIKWLLIAVALPSFRLPEPPIYSSLLLLVAMFGHFGIEHGTGIHWKQIVQMRKTIGPQWLSTLNILLCIVAIIGSVVLAFCRQWLEQSSREVRIAFIYVLLISLAGWWLSYLILTDRALNHWFKDEKQV